MDTRTCGYCGGSLQGMRPQARYCKASCRVMATNRRREERQIREATLVAFRHFVRDHGTDEEQAAYEDLAGRFPDFEKTNARALRGD
ncbi:hypothetical protein [Nocardioides sp. GXQ0305]|uniref:hypothetical protein n=1 Tax=Nocardioides sp. GXQ0305 TaxID=3423912 RepID=UPI003D7C5AAB